MSQVKILPENGISQNFKILQRTLAFSIRISQVLGDYDEFMLYHNWQQGLYVNEAKRLARLALERIYQLGHNDDLEQTTFVVKEMVCPACKQKNFYPKLLIPLFPEFKNNAPKTLQERRLEAGTDFILKVSCLCDHCKLVRTIKTIGTVPKGYLFAHIRDCQPKEIAKSLGLSALDEQKPPTFLRDSLEKAITLALLPDDTSFEPEES